MKHLIIAAMLLFSTSSLAGQAIYQQLYESPEMNDRCMERLDYYERLVEKFKPGAPDEDWVKWQWCKNQLEDWERYCYGEYIE